ncbi:hypothetical protein [Glutamicibacter sp. NPDC087344]|uniref:hypothetical protein n=1 Tax=Glutamicibacter sp. NPDC087344 TaxID=3363994 RepID=UPI003818B0BC
MPFEAVLAQNEISGERRAALNLVLGAVLSRARGQEPQVVRAKPMIELFPVLSLAQANGGIDLAEAIRLVAEVVGSQALAFEVLKAHKGSGFGEDGYEALGL